MSSAPPARAPARSWPICASGHRVTCVVDGDTIWLEGTKIRLEQIDAPEVENYRCAAEKALGDRATLRLRDILSNGGWTISRDGGRDEDVYGRKLRTIHVGADTAGLMLYREGLAHLWDGRKHPWC